MLRLRPYKKCDAKYIANWIKDERTLHQWCVDRFQFPLTGEMIAAHYDEMNDRDDFFGMTAFDNSGVVGHLFIRFPDEEKKTARFGFVIVDDEKRGKGLGKEMVSLAVKYSFDILKAEKVTMGVFENNLSAYHCYKAAGFEDIILPEDEYLDIGSEKWKCLELEYPSFKYYKS